MTSGSRNSASRRLRLIKMFHMGAVLLICLCRVSAADAPAVALTEFIYESAPFPECHASTIAETTNGQLIAAWFGGTEEKDPDVGIWVSRRVEGKWTEPVDLPAHDMSWRINCRHGQCISSQHTGDGAFVGFCDGTVTFVKEGTDVETIEGLSTISGREPVSKESLSEFPY